MPNAQDLITDLTLPRGVWTKATANGPPKFFRVMNKGTAELLAKKSVAAPTDAAGAMPIGPRHILPEEDLTVHGYDVWLLCESADGLAAIEALQ